VEIFLKWKNIENICSAWGQETAQLILKAAETEIARIGEKKGWQKNNF